MRTGGIAHYTDNTDRPEGRVNPATGDAYLHLDAIGDAWITTGSSLYLRRLAAEADRLADALDAHAAAKTLAPTSGA